MGALLGAGAQFVQLINEPERISGNILKGNCGLPGTIITVPAGRVWKGTLTCWALAQAGGTLCEVYINSTITEVTSMRADLTYGPLFATVSNILIYGGNSGQAVTAGGISAANGGAAANGVLIA